MNSQSEGSSQASNESVQPRGSKFGGYFSKLKQAIIRSTESQPSENTAPPAATAPTAAATTTTSANQNDREGVYIQSDQIDIAEPLPTNFGIPEKRKRLSIQGHPTDESIPRSLTRGVVNPRHTSYSNIYNEIKTNEEESHNDLERRKSVIDSFILPSKDNSILTSREDSPALNIPFPKNTIGVDSLIEVEDEERSEEEEYEQLEIVQIDPAERSRIVRLKRSIQEIESMRKKIRYMKSPNETTTISHGDSTMVDTSTQTYNTDYLNSVLNFKKRSSSSTLENNRNKRRKKGFFLKDLVYDVKKPVDVVTSTNLKGYASELGKPKFKASDDDGTKKLNSRSTVNGSALGQKLSLSLDSDYVAKTQSVSDIIKLKEDSLKTPSGVKNGAIAPSSGFQFNIDDKRLRDIVGSQREKTEGGTTTATKKQKAFICETEAKPSEKASTPLFSFKPTIKDNVEESKDDTSKSTSVEFGKKKEEVTKPSVIFGQGSSNSFVLPNESISNHEKSPSPFTFGGASTTGANDEIKKPDITASQSKDGEGSQSGLFKFEPSKNTPVSGFGSKPSGRLFGQPSENKEKYNDTGIKANGSASGPTVNAFSSISQPEPGSDKSKEDKGSQPNEAGSEGGDMKRKRTAPSDKSNTNDAEPPMSKSSPPAFAFNAIASGEGDSQKASSAPAAVSKQPAFSFGFNPSSSATDDKDKAKSTTPGFVFGKGDSTDNEDKVKAASAVPTFSFGKPADSTTDNDKGKSVSPAFSFGKPAGTTTDDDKSKPVAPAFGFGKSDNKAKSASPAFLFGKTDDQDKPKPASQTFSFDEPAEKSKSAAPVFSFGKTDSLDDKGKSPSPAFTFGQKKDESNDKASGKTSTSTPTPTSTSGGSTSAFSFGNAGTSGTAAGSKDKQQSTATTSGFKFAPGVTPPPTTAPATSASTATSLFGASTGGSNIAAPKPFSATGFGGFGSQSQSQPSATATSTAPVFGSRPSTPTFNFSEAAGQTQGQGQGNGLPPPSSIFGSATKLNKVPSFNFTGSKSGTPDPASVFGQHSQAQQTSRESTPFGGGGSAVPSFGFGQPQQQGQPQAQQPFTFGGSPAPGQPQVQQPQVQVPSFGFNAGGAVQGVSGGPTMMGSGFAPNGQSMPATATTPQANPRRPRLLPRSRRR
ncbi:hypothetical protein CORT_0H02180 [Candida orthopsilosis Co 90-125]|uniref:Uncharacterized protein n=1 Tax=Candida orthopsilosis (strain 90-125) TaxID=1136231 RepID=H8XB79_CANO9|nr:hypothetical protein CORT_0H02180 [Candida orthopsilosis Co 90-125]CCG25328.1 hypothetical protein CORT_0H02180 [Candida orthopsilosis Co 90-125]